MAKHLDESNIGDFLFFFNLYYCANPNTPSTLFFKAAALLAYLSEGDTVEFNKAIQTVEAQDLENEFVQLVLHVSDSISRFDVGSLKHLSESCTPKLRLLVGRVFERQKAALERTLQEPIGARDFLDHTHDSTAVIQDCVFVVENFAGN